MSPEKKSNSPFGCRVRKIRTEKGLSVAELAGRLGCNKDTVYKLERGDRGQMYERIPGLARALGCTIDDLFRGLDNEGAEKNDEQDPQQMADERED